MNLIACVDKNYGIGLNNNLLFNIPADLEYFKNKTLGKIVVMGKNTFLSLPFQKPLANRRNIVLSSSLKTDCCIVCSSISELFKELSQYNSDDTFVIGGSEIYSILINYCSTAFITKVNSTQKSDSFLPNIEKFENWELISKSEEIISGDYTITFNTYKNNKIIPKEV